MAYEIISQNNNTTTLSDGTNTITVPSRVVLATGTTYEITEVNNSTATLEGSDGSVIRDVPCVAVLAGGGGGDSHNLGWYATKNDLETAHATAEAGDWAIVGATDTVWVWDTDTSAWVDTDTKGQVTSVNNKTGDVTIGASDVLPTQTGNSGKFLTTDGTDASWSDKPLVNNATGTNSVSTGGASAATYDDSIVIGRYAKTSTRGVSLGHSANSGLNTQVYYTTSIGAYSRASNTSATALGYNAQATGANSIVLCGSNYSTPASATATHSIQLGYGTNSTANTFNVGLSETDNYRLLSSNGTIPADRLPNAINKYSSMPTAASTNLGWIVQYTGTTDANYTHGYIYECVSDGGNPATYSWSAVSVQAGGSSLPSQTGNSGKFLTTDGTDASWGNALANKATGTNAISVLGNASSNSNAINIGAGTTGGTSGIAIGSNAYSASQTVAIGYDSTTSNQGTAVGYNAVARDYCVAVGYQAKVAMNTYYGTAIGYTANVASGAKGAIQLGKGTNSTAGTFSVGLSTDGSTWNNYELLSANGTVPHARLTNAVVSNSISIAVADWNGGTTCSKTVSGLTATSVVWVAPDNASQSDYLTAGVYASAQTTDTITFTCTTTPTSALTVNVIYC